MFIETQNGRIVSLDSLTGIERVGNEIYGFRPDGKNILIGSYPVEEFAVDEFDRIKRGMNYYAVLIPQGEDDYDDLTGWQDN